MEKENKILILRLILATILLIGAVIVEKTCNLPTWQLLCVYLIPYCIIGYDIVKGAILNIINREFLDESFLITIATIGALCIGFFPNMENMFIEAVVVLLFFKIGVLFEEMAEHKSRQSIAELMDIKPDVAYIEKNGEIIKIDPYDAVKGDIAIVRPGEKVPFDGIVIEGHSSLNTTALTGESLPKNVSANDYVASGCININGLLKIKVLKPFSQSTATKIIELVEHANEKKAKSEKFIRKFARIYTPIIVFLSLLLAFIPPIIIGDFMVQLPIWLARALTFLVVSCPCALVISVPLSFFGGIGGASKKGILIKGANYIETLAKTKIVVFDKTGTLTKGVFKVTDIHPDKISANELLHLAAHVERYSNHPIAQSLKQAYPNEKDSCQVSNVEEIVGKGIKAKVNDKEVYVGNALLMTDLGIILHNCEDCHNNTGTILHICINGTYAGHIVISDQIKEDSIDSIKQLKQLGIEQVIMLTGDKQDVAQQVAQKIGLDKYYANLLPTHKVQKVEEIIKHKPNNKKLAFVGDGINDAPVLALSDVGIAMGGIGSQAAIEAANVVIMDDKLSKIGIAIRIARKTLSIAKQNIVFAIGVKVLVLILATFGFATMWMAIFADVGVTILCILNASRALKIKKGF